MITATREIDNTVTRMSIGCSMIRSFRGRINPSAIWPDLDIVVRHVFRGVVSMVNRSDMFRGGIQPQGSDVPPMNMFPSVDI